MLIDKQVKVKLLTMYSNIHYYNLGMCFESNYKIGYIQYEIEKLLAVSKNP